MQTIHIVLKDANKKSQCFYSENWNQFPDVYKLYGLKEAIKRLQKEYNKQRLLLDISDVANDDDDFVFFV
jgi:hypothetical protein